MECTNKFCLSLGLAISFVCAPAFAQEAHQDSVLPSEGIQSAPSQPQGHKPQPLSAPSVDQDVRDQQRTVPGAYRLTYTLTEMDGSKRLGSQRYVINLDADAPPAHLDLGARIPTFSYGQGSYKYEDIGVKIDSSLRQFANGMELSTQLMQNELAGNLALTELVENQVPIPTHPSDGTPHVNKTGPIIRQSVLRTVALLTENKPMILGLLDKPGTTQSLQVAVELTRVR